MAKKPMSAAHKAAATRAKNRGGKDQPAPVTGPANEQQNISIRKIDNGYLVSQSEYKRGQYVERQTYTPTKPQIAIANAPKAKG